MTARFGLAVFLAGCCCFALGQTTEIVPDSELFDTFFRQVSTAALLSKSVPPDAVPTIQRVIGLTGQDVETLNGTAEDCMAEVARLGGAVSALTFESTLQVAEFGKVSEEATRRLQELADQRSQIVMSHVARLKSTLSAASFRNLDRYVHAPPANKPSLRPTMVPRTATPDRPDEKPGQ